MFVKAG